MRRVWMVFAAVMICWGVQAQEGFDAKMRRAGLVPYRREWWHYEEPMAMSEVRTRYKLLDF